MTCQTLPADRGATLARLAIWAVAAEAIEGAPSRPAFQRATELALAYLPATDPARIGLVAFGQAVIDDATCTADLSPAGIALRRAVERSSWAGVSHA